MMMHATAMLERLCCHPFPLLMLKNHLITKHGFFWPKLLGALILPTATVQQVKVSGAIMLPPCCGVLQILLKKERMDFLLLLLDNAGGIIIVCYLHPVNEGLHQKNQMNFPTKKQKTAEKSLRRLFLEEKKESNEKLGCTVNIERLKNKLFASKSNVGWLKKFHK